MLMKNNRDDYYMRQVLGEIKNGRSHMQLFIFMLVVTCAVFWQTIYNTTKIWWDMSDTYVHGMFVVPAVCWMVYDQREKLRQITPQINLYGLIPLLLISAGWFVANLAEIAVGMQLSFFAMIPMLVLIIFGWNVTKALSFPLGYLLFAVPIGEFLIPPLMDFTAWFTVHALEVTGIPVYREGLTFEIPTGSFNVIKACSGIRYLIASIALGCLYAYLTYKTIWRRALFIVLSIVFPIIANGMRAYGIVMISYLSEGELGSGVDHFVYGWVWFGLVMFVMFWIGSLWREKSTQIPCYPKQVNLRATTSSGIVAIISALLFVIILAPVAANYVKDGEFDERTDVRMSEMSLGWRQVALEPLIWKPIFYGSDYTYLAGHNNGKNTVYTFMPFYKKQESRKELVNVGNKFYDDGWSLMSSTQLQETINSESQNVMELRIKNGNKRGLVWGWYVIGERPVTNTLLAKSFQLETLLSSRDSSGYAVVLMTQMDDGVEDSRDVLRQFAMDNQLSLQISMKND